MTFSSPSRDSRGTNRKQSIKPDDYADLAVVKPQPQKGPRWRVGIISRSA
jgi:hypothetical protein